MSLFHSGRRILVSYYSFAFTAAGSCPYEDDVAGTTGRVRVPSIAPSTATSGMQFTVQWAAVAPAAGYVFDVTSCPHRLYGAAGRPA
jgi:hypothetical protein